MKRMTEALIERVIAIGGSFYLPYRLHARRDQVDKAYANVARFIERKRHYDPQLLFRNAMWDAYFSQVRSESNGFDSPHCLGIRRRSGLRRGSQLHPGPHRRAGPGVRHLRARHL